MAQNLYGPGVRMGNWNEDVFLEEGFLAFRRDILRTFLPSSSRSHFPLCSQTVFELEMLLKEKLPGPVLCPGLSFTLSLHPQERMRDFLEKREKGELLIQRNRRLKKNLLRPMELSVSQDGFVHYGDKVILVNPDHPRGEEAGVFLEGDMCLCVSPDEVKAQLYDELEMPCGVSAVQTTVPTGRNTFTILSDSTDRSTVGQVLRYGQSFCLGIAAGLECKTLYLSSDHRTLLKCSKKSWLQEVTLTDENSHLNGWQATFLDPQLRLEYEGFPVRANEKLILYHRHTNRALAAHRHLPLRTYFGKEVEVAAHTHLDSHRVEKPKNHWMLVTGNPRNKTTTMLDLPKPPTDDTRAVEQAMGIST